MTWLMTRGAMLVLAALAIGSYSRVQAQDYPARPITIVVTAVLWAILHIQYDWFFVVEIVTLGLFFGWMRWKSGSTLLTMMLHSLNNGLALVALTFGQ